MKLFEANKNLVLIDNTASDNSLSDSSSNNNDIKSPNIDKIKNFSYYNIIGQDFFYEYH